MYRVAVIENETELQRYGHANVVRNLSNAIISRPDANQYSFQSFTSANIESLFQIGTNYILEFDGLFISTNAFSDKVVLNCFQRNKNKIVEFIESDKGIYIGYQKKLSIEIKNKEKNTVTIPKKLLTITDKNPFDFLPNEYQYRLIEEFAIKENEPMVFRVKESAEGDIKIYDKNRDDVILNYPNNIKENEILKQCRKNDFQNHLYKSSIYPILQGSYEILIYDNAPDDSEKRILLAKAIPKKKERIIVSSIVFDWENHKSILLNIIEFISKGIPQFAFVQGEDLNINKDFNHLINSAIIAKIPCENYKNSSEISVDMQFIHDVYIFSPSVHEIEVNNFWNKLKGINKSKKVYHLLSHLNGETVLKQYSNTSSFEALKANIDTWIKSYKIDNNGFWDGFWVTYDTLLMMKEVDMNYPSYLEEIYKGIYKRRHIEGSYDRLIGCTLGMLKLYFDFWPNKIYEIEQTVNWINSRIFPKNNNDLVNSMPISIFEKESFLLTYKELEKQQSGKYKINIKGEKYELLIEEVYNTLVKPQRDGKDCSEIELCRHLAFCINFEKNDDVRIILDSIFDRSRRDYEGKWSSVGRTAGVLISLISTLGKDKINKYQLEKKIEQSINYILKQYNRVNCNWNSLVLDTSRAIHALKLYDSMFSLSSRDFFETLQHNAELIGYNNIIETSILTSSELQKKLYNVYLEKELLNNQITQLKNDIDNNEKEIEEIKNEKDHDKQKFENQIRLGLGFSIFFGMIIFGLLSFIHFDLKGINKLLSSTDSIIKISIGLFITFIIDQLLKFKFFSISYRKKK